jgi:hypothetical protein
VDVALPKAGGGTDPIQKIIRRHSTEEGSRGPALELYYRSGGILVSASALSLCWKLLSA